MSGCLVTVRQLTIKAGRWTGEAPTHTEKNWAFTIFFLSWNVVMLSCKCAEWKLAVCS